jgi:hypothetical protein
MEVHEEDIKQAVPASITCLSPTQLSSTNLFSQESKQTNKQFCQPLKPSVNLIQNLQLNPSEIMASYLVAGASRGLGFEYLRQLSANPDNVVVGLVRNVEATKEKVAAEINRPNIHLFYADLDDYKTLPVSASLMAPSLAPFTKPQK